MGEVSEPWTKAVTPTSDSPLWEIPIPLECPHIEAIESLPPKWRVAQDRVTWDDFKSLLDARIPADELVTLAGFTFGIVHIRGRRMIVTAEPRLRAYLSGPGIFAMPSENVAG